MKSEKLAAQVKADVYTIRCEYQPKQYSDEKLTVSNYSFPDGPDGVKVELKTNPPTLVYHESNWGCQGWRVEQYNPGKWVAYIHTIAEKIRKQDEIVRKKMEEERNKQEAARWAPVDDSDLFD
jgi:hypothetical protein